MIYILLLVLAQVLLEVLPVSSSGHMCLVDLFFKIKSDVILPAHFDHFLHGPMIIILMVFFRDRWVPLIALFFKFWSSLRPPVVAGDIPPMPLMKSTEVALMKDFMRLVFVVVLADAITGVMYCGVRMLEKKGILTYSPQSLLVGFFFTALILLLLKVRRVVGSHDGKMTAATLPWPYVMCMGFAQGVGLFPGISRFACTYVFSRMLGMSTRTAFEFAFLLLYPLILFAFLVNGMPSMLYLSSAALVMSAPVFVTMLVATCMAYLLFAWVYDLARAEKLWLFAFYMVVPIGLVLLKVFAIL